MAAIKKPVVSTRHGFKTGEQIVYPAHGVGTIVAIDEQEVAGMKLELFVIDFEKDKITQDLKVTNKVIKGIIDGYVLPIKPVRFQGLTCRGIR